MQGFHIRKTLNYGMANNMTSRTDSQCVLSSSHYARHVRRV